MFLIENGGNDIGFMQGLDALGVGASGKVLGIDLATGKPAEWLSFSSASNFETPYTFFISGDMPAGAYSAELIGSRFGGLAVARASRMRRKRGMRGRACQRGSV